MNSTGDPALVQEAWRFVRDFNRTWVSGAPEKLASFFHRDVVLVEPDFFGRRVGRDAAVVSYVEFCSQVNILAFDEREPDVDVFGDTAIVSYTFDISYEQAGTRHREQGRDLFVLKQERRRWRVIWRTLLVQE